MNKYDYLINNFVSPYNFVDNDHDIFLNEHKSSVLSDKLLNNLIFNANIYSNKNNSNKVKNFSKKNSKKQINNNTKKYRNRLSKKNLKFKKINNNVTNKKIILK